MGAFAYSEEEGTFAARHYADDIPQEEKGQQLKRIYKGLFHNGSAL